MCRQRSAKNGDNVREKLKQKNPNETAVRIQETGNKHRQTRITPSSRKVGSNDGNIQFNSNVQR